MYHQGSHAARYYPGAVAELVGNDTLPDKQVVER
jgi:hypothetical protein